jgi:transposase
MRFVALKTAEQQNALVLHRMRTGFVEEQTALINRPRGELSEFGAHAIVDRAAVVGSEDLRSPINGKVNGGNTTAA